MRIWLLLAVVVLTGCARSQMSYENRDEDVISFSERLVIDFSSGMDKAIHRLKGNNIYRSGQYKVFEKDFFPMNAGDNGVRQAYQIHCEKKVGRFQNDSCINQNGELLYKISLSPGAMWTQGGLSSAGQDDIRSTLLVVRKPNTSMRVAQAPKTTKPETSSFKLNIDQRMQKYRSYLRSHTRLSSLGNAFLDDVSLNLANTLASILQSSTDPRYLRVLQMPRPKSSGVIRYGEFQHQIHYQSLGRRDCHLLSIITSYFPINSLGQKEIRPVLFSQDKIQACGMSFPDGKEYFLSPV